MQAKEVSVMTEIAAENRKSASGTKSGVRALAVTGVLSAAAFVLQLVEIPVPFLMPTFVKFDFSDLPALLGAFALGPVWGIVIELVKNLLHGLMSTSSFGVGELCNFALGAVFAGTAGLIYRFHKTKKGAVAASLIGAIVMAAYQAIIPSIKSVEQSLLVFNVPFTFVKGMIDVVVTFLIYKKLSPILKGTK